MLLFFEMILLFQFLSFIYLFIYLSFKFVHPATDTHGGKEIWKAKLGKCDFTLASLLLLKMNSSAEGPIYLSTECLLNPQDIVLATQNFTSWVIWGSSREPSAFLNTSTELALLLLRHGQYDAVEVHILPYATLDLSPFCPSLLFF